MSTEARLEMMLSMGRWAEAEDLARSAIVERPGDGELHAHLARALLGQGKLAKADAAATRAIRSLPDDSYPHRVKAAVLASTGFVAPAIDSLDEAVRLAPYDYSGYVMRAELHLHELERLPRFGGRRLPAVARRIEAITSDLAVAEQIAPNDADIHVLRAELHLLDKNYDASHTAALEALRLRADHAGAHELLGRIAESRGDHRSAGGHYVTGGRADPRSQSSLIRLRRLGMSGLVLPGVIAFFVFRAIVGRSGGFLAFVIVVALTGAFVGGLAAYRRREARSVLDPDAQNVLDADDATRRRRFR